MAKHLYSFLDLKQNRMSYPVKGYKQISKELSWQPRAVKKYAEALEDAGLIRIEKSGSKKAKIWVVYNPARGRHNPGVTLMPAGKRAGHGSNADPEARVTRSDLHATRSDRRNPDAQRAPGSISFYLYISTCGRVARVVTNARHLEWAVSLQPEPASRKGCGEPSRRVLPGALHVRALTPHA